MKHVPAPEKSNTGTGLNISEYNGGLIIKHGDGPDIILTKEESEIVATGAVPSGLSGKLTTAQIKTLKKLVKDKAKKEKKKKSKSDAKRELDAKMPDWATVADAIKQKYRIRTIPELGTDKETIYYFNGQIYERAEEILKAEAHALYIDAWKEILNTTYDPKASEVLMKRLRKGPSSSDIHEVINNIRRTTFTSDQMNPDSHIPFLNGLLNLKTRTLEPFSADLFFTYQVDANLLSRYVTLRDVPLFNSLLNGVFYEPDIPMTLAYASYALRPDFPVHKILFVLGRERIGKGTFVRVIQGLMKKGFGSFSLARILTGERFQFTGVEGKNLLVDSETKRKFRRGTVLDWSLFCNLFGGDILSVEPKGREAHDYVSRAKGIVLGNLPFIHVDSPPSIARILIVETRNERPKKVIPNLDEKILADERDLITTLLVQLMFKHEERNFMFPGQMTDDATAEILEELADPVANFADEMTDFVEGENTRVDDAYAAFSDWCAQKGIPVLKSQVFKKSFSHYYEKRRLGPRGEREYVFANCLIYSSELEVERKTTLQVGHGVDSVQTQKISASGERYRRVQHERTTFACEKKEYHDYNSNNYNKRVSVRKLDTGKLPSGEPKNKVPDDITTVSNLDREISPDNYSSITGLTAGPLKSDTTRETDRVLPIIENSPKTHDPGHPAESNADPMKSDVQSEKYPMTEEDGKLIIDQLLNLGYQVDLNSGPDINRKYFKVGIPALSSLPADKREHLERIMGQEHFTLFNQGAFGIHWYTRPLIDASEEGKP